MKNRFQKSGSQLVSPLAAVLVAGLLIAGTATAAEAPQANSPVEIQDAWARATVPGQAAGGVFMRLESPVAMTLVSVSSPAAKIAQVHEMKSERGMMVMRVVPQLSLPAHMPVTLKPNGMHVMLFQLKEPLAVGAHFPLTLVFSDGHSQSTETVDVAVRPLSAS